MSQTEPQPTPPVDPNDVEALLRAARTALRAEADSLEPLKKNNEDGDKPARRNEQAIARELFALEVDDVLRRYIAERAA